MITSIFSSWRSRPWTFLTAWALSSLVLDGCGTELNGSAQLADFGDANERGLTHEASHFEPELGKGVDGAETRTFVKCVTFPDPTIQPAAAFSERLFNEHHVTSRSELDRHLGISAAIGAKNLWGSARASSSYISTVDISEDSTYWLVDAYYQLQHESIPTNSAEFSLTPRALSILKNHGMKGFERACGTHFYVGRTLGARYSLVYEFHGSQNKFSEVIKAAASGNAFGIEASAEFDQAVNTAKRAAALTVHSSISGGGANVSDYTLSSKELLSALLMLRQDLHTNKQGETLKWETVRYDIFREVQEALEQGSDRDVCSLDKKSALEFYYERYISNRSRHHHIQNMLAKSSGSVRKFEFSPVKIDLLKMQSSRLLLQNQEITLRATDCIKDLEAACDMTQLDPVLDDSPHPDLDLTGTGRWSFAVMAPPGGADLVFIGSAASPKNKKNPVVRIFPTNNGVLDTNAGPLLMPGPNTSNRFPTELGSLRSTHRSGTIVPSLCLNEYASVCSFEVIEDASQVLEDGLPYAAIHIVVFNHNGEETDRRIFPCNV